MAPANGVVIKSFSGEGRYRSTMKVCSRPFRLRPGRWACTWALITLACSNRADSEKTDAGGERAVEPTEAAIPDDVAQLLASRLATVKLPREFDVTLNGEGRVDVWATPVGEKGYALGYDLGSEPADTSEIHPMAARAMHVFLYNYATADSAPGHEPVGAPTTLSSDEAARFGADVVIRACFEPADYLRGDFAHGVGYGFYKRDVGMTMALLLTDDAGACAAPADPALFGFSYL